MEFAGYFAAILIGLVLGIMGGGGSILAVPVLVYLFGFQPVISTSYSLFIVGFTAFIGAWNYYRNKEIDFKAALYFGFPSMVSVFFTRKIILPSLPEFIPFFGMFEINKQTAIMVLFSILMVISAVSMIRKKKYFSSENGEKPDPLIIILAGAGEGLLTGLVGAGGGFLIIPALVVLTGIDMKKAVGTSLLIIAVKSVIGFFGDFGHIVIDPLFLAVFSALTAAGIIIGIYSASKISGEKLKPAFGWFVLVMGAFILIKEIIIK